MPKRTFPADAEGMPNYFNRRSFLQGIGTAGALVGVVASPAVVSAASASVTGEAENDELLRLRDLLVECLTKRQTIEAEINTIADEWRDRWPLAPEEILGAAIHGGRNAWAIPDAERDIVSHVIHRETSTLTKRLPRKWRVEGQRQAFAVDASEDLEKELKFWRSYEVEGRTAKVRARRSALKAERIESYSSRLLLARQYEAETARIREVSAMDATKQRLAQVEVDIAITRESLSREAVFTNEGLRIRAEALRDEVIEYYGEGYATIGGFFGRSHRLALAVASQLAPTADTRGTGTVTR